ncbi:MAG: DUF4387 domain-containing protein [Rhizomicrobium sp.]
MKLAELSSLIRSKNAGPFVLTFDIMFPDDQSYQRVKTSAVLSTRRFAQLFKVSESEVLFFECDNARAFKFSIPRPCSQGELGDGDLHGGQQYAPLLNIDIP